VAGHPDFNGRRWHFSLAGGQPRSFLSELCERADCRDPQCGPARLVISSLNTVECVERGGGALLREPCRASESRRWLVWLSSAPPAGGTKIITVKADQPRRQLRVLGVRFGGHTCSGEHARHRVPPGVSSSRRNPLAAQQCVNGVAKSTSCSTAATSSAVRYECAQPPVPSRRDRVEA